MDWSGVDYLWIIVMFLSAVWTLILHLLINLQYMKNVELCFVGHTYEKFDVQQK